MSSKSAASGPHGHDRLAPVTYLPGVKPGAGAEHDSEPEWRAPLAEAVGADGPRDTSRAARVAVHQLARRGMSRWELERVLARREVDEDTARAELDRLESVGLLDDAALAVSIVHTRHTRKGLGRAALEHELHRRHIAPEIIADALNEIGADDERARARELAFARAQRLQDVDDATAERRLSGYLARKGYRGEDVRAVVREALAQRRPSVRFR